MDLRDHHAGEGGVLLLLVVRSAELMALHSRPALALSKEHLRTEKNIYSTLEAATSGEWAFLRRFLSQASRGREKGRYRCNTECLSTFLLYYCEYSECDTLNAMTTANSEGLVERQLQTCTTMSVETLGRFAILTITKLMKHI